MESPIHDYGAHPILSIVAKGSCLSEVEKSMDLRGVSQRIRSDYRNDPAGLNLAVLLERLSSSPLIIQATETEISLLVASILSRDTRMCRESTISSKLRLTIHKFLTFCFQIIIDRSLDLERFGKLLIREHIYKQYESNLSISVPTLIPQSAQLDSLISELLLNHVLSLHDAASIANYLKFLTWVSKSMSVNYLSWVPSLLPKFLSSQDVRKETINLCIALLTSNPVVAHIVLESVPDCIESVLHFMTEHKPDYTNSIGPLMLSVNNFPSPTLVIEHIETEFILDSNPVIRADSLKSILSFCGFQKNGGGKELPLILGRLLDRDPSVRQIVWTYIGTLPRVSDSIDAILLIAKCCPCHHEIFIGIDTLLNSLVAQTNCEPIDILTEIMQKKCEKSQKFIRKFFEFKRFSRQIIQSIAFVISSENKSDPRVSIEKNRAVRMCAEWANRASINEKSTKKLFTYFNIDLIEILIKLYSPTTPCWPMKQRLLAEVKSIVPTEWHALFTHSVNPFLDRRSVDLVIAEPEGIELIKELTNPEYREELEEPGLVNWEFVVNRIFQLCKSASSHHDLAILVLFFGKITTGMDIGQNTLSTDKLHAFLEMIKSGTLPKIRKNLFRALLWYDFDSISNIICQEQSLLIDDVLASEFAVFIKRHKSSLTNNLIELLPPNSSAKWIVDISLVSRNSAFDDMIIVHKNLLRAVDVHDDCPAWVLAELVIRLRKVDSSLRLSVTRKLFKMVFPKSKCQADIVAFCGGVRIDLVPVIYLSSQSVEKNLLFKFLTKSNNWSDSIRRIIEYIVSLFVFIATMVEPRGIVEDSARNFITDIVNSSYTNCKDNIAATIAATLDALCLCEPKTTMTPVTDVVQVCSIVRKCLIEIHVKISSMTLEKSYQLSVGLALFRPLANSVIESGGDKDPLILKRRRM